MRIKNIVNNLESFLFLNKSVFNKKYIVPNKKEIKAISANKGKGCPPNNTLKERLNTNVDIMTEFLSRMYLHKIL